MTRKTVTKTVLRQPCHVAGDPLQRWEHRAGRRESTGLRCAQNINVLLSTWLGIRGGAGKARAQSWSPIPWGFVVSESRGKIPFTLYSLSSVNSWVTKTQQLRLFPGQRSGPRRRSHCCGAPRSQDVVKGPQLVRLTEARGASLVFEFLSIASSVLLNIQPSGIKTTFAVLCS